MKIKVSLKDESKRTKAIDHWVEQVTRALNSPEVERKIFKAMHDAMIDYALYGFVEGGPMAKKKAKKKVSKKKPMPKGKC